MTNDSISSHLLELRSRLLKVIILFSVLSIIGIPFAAEIYSFVADPLVATLPAGTSMIATGVASPFMAPIKLVLYVALLFTMPWLFIQIWMFISPGLYENEKSFTAPLMASTIILFFCGVSFAFFIVCPIIFKFFIGMAPSSIQVMTDINEYLGFIFKLVFAFGIAFEIPVATVLLVNSKIVTKRSLTKARPYLIVVFLIIGMLLTPPDIFSQLFLAFPMWLLFEIGILLSKNK
ncbi:MAG: twin-arginine translocase subunit TatC [SAR86 cluster bacterium]|jgi:sec-independent protein translocase protein TatC|nr:MAG: twin-arginine translocase subunit TatC [SAR86 cluster bacterium]URQ69626.1 twin-arginine translocase subunit TatC [SAR86 cluster bacterium]|tara:strand:+ start:592 stop:1293 length:702 start_codon:yes stop_codon:yes gene_type:complete